MAKEIKRTIKVEYIPIIDKLEAALKKVTKVIKDPKSADIINKATNKLLSTKKQIEAKGGLLSVEEAKLFNKTIEKTIKGLEPVSKELMSMFSMAGRKAIQELSAEVKRQSLALGGKRKSLAASQNRVTDVQGKFIPNETNASFMKAAEKSAFNSAGMASTDGARAKAIAEQEKLNQKITESNELSNKHKAILYDTHDVSGKRLEYAKTLSQELNNEISAEQIIKNLDEQQAIRDGKEAYYAKEIKKQEKLVLEIKKDQLALDEQKLKKVQLVNQETKNLVGEGLDFDEETNEALIKTANIKKQLTAEEKKLNKQKKEGLKTVKKEEGALKKATKQVLSYGMAFTVLRRLYRETIKTIKELDEALTEMAIVTTMSREDTWQLVGTMQQLAKETGFTTTEISKLSTVYFRQGRNLSDVIELTTVAAKAARIAGISAQESADYLTSAINGFGLAAEKALEVSDKFAALAASSASSYEELAKGLSKFAAQANVAGLSIDFAMGMLAKGVETTREAPETIGTALKTVLARLRELTDYGKTLEDGMDVNRVETALGAMNVELMDANGQFRDMESVLTDLGNIWNTLNTNQQASIAVALAGTRQQSRLIAVMQDFDRTLELVDTAEDSAGATMAQHVEYMRSMEAAMVNLQNAWQKFITTISDSGFIIDIVNGISSGIEALTLGIDKLGAGGKVFMITLAGAVVLMKAFTMLTALNNKMIAIAAGTQTSLTMAKVRDLAVTKLAITREAIATGVIEASTVAKRKEIMATAAETVAENALVAAKNKSTAATTRLNAVMALNPIFVLLAAITAGVLLYGYFSNAVEKNAAAFKKMSEEVQAANFELAQTEKKISGLISKIEELNKLRFLTPEQITELETLNESLSEAIPEELKGKLVYLKSGGVDFAASRDALLKYLEDNAKEQYENSRKLVAQSIESNNVDFNKDGSVARDAYGQSITSKGFTSGSLDYESLNTVDKQKAVVDFYMAEYRKNLGDAYEDLTDAEVSAYRSYLQDTVENDPAEMLWYDKDPSKSFKTWQEYLSAAANEFTIESKNISSLITEARNKIDDENITFSERLANMRTLLLKSNETETKMLERQYGYLISMAEEFSKEEISAMEGIGLTNVDAIQEGLSIYGDRLDNIITLVKSKSDSLIANGISATQAYSMAWSQVSEMAETSEGKLWAYSIAFKDSMLEVAQTLDNVSSKIENINEKQQEWLDGSLSSEDLYSFFQDNSDLFKTMEDIERFLSGDRIDSQRFIEAVEAEQTSVAGLYNAQFRLNEATEGTAEHQQALLDIGFYRALLQYTGDLAKLTIEQQTYNSELDQYNRLTELGITDAEQKARLDESRLVYTQVAINIAKKGMSEIESEFDETATSVGLLAGGFMDYFKIVNGTIVPIYGEMDNLTKKQMELIVSTMDEYQNELNSAFDVFKDLRDADLKDEKEKIDEQKALYTDYFKKIDELENKANQAQTKEDIIAQLQRLEGATDERSRQKALELRKDLLALDEEISAEQSEAARTALLESLDDSYTELEEAWALAGEQFISDMTLGGIAAANAFLETLGIGTKLMGPDPEDKGETRKAAQDESIFRKSNYIDAERENEMNNLRQEHAWEIGQGFLTTEDLTRMANENLSNRYDNDMASAKDIYVSQRASGLAIQNQTLQGNLSYEDAYRMAVSSLSQEFDRLYGEIYIPGTSKPMLEYAKGGMVDFTGVAALHGSSRSPEAVLSAEQTKMFVTLRDALGEVALGKGNSSESISIEQITIKTDKLNSTQDFDVAGKVLASAFNKAIKNRGITTNIKR